MLLAHSARTWIKPVRSGFRHTRTASDVQNCSPFWNSSLKFPNYLAYEKKVQRPEEQREGGPLPGAIHG